jgi:hypothetical protein
VQNELIKDNKYSYVSGHPSIYPVQYKISTPDSTKKQKFLLDSIPSEKNSSFPN